MLGGFRSTFQRVQRTTFFHLNTFQMYKISNISFSGEGAVTALTITDNSGNVVFTFCGLPQQGATQPRQQTADNAPKAANFKPKQPKGKDTNGMIPKPLYARLMACKTEADLQAAIAANKFWRDNANFQRTVEKAREKLNG